MKWEEEGAPVQEDGSSFSPSSKPVGNETFKIILRVIVRQKSGKLFVK
jgi:hypothetical protein